MHVFWGFVCQDAPNGGPTPPRLPPRKLLHMWLKEAGETQKYQQRKKKSVEDFLSLKVTFDFF